MAWACFLEGEGDWVIDKNNLGPTGQYTGRHQHMATPHTTVKHAYPAGRMSTRPLACLEALGGNHPTLFIPGEYDMRHHTGFVLQHLKDFKPSRPFLYRGFNGRRASQYLDDAF